MADDAHTGDTASEGQGPTLPPDAGGAPPHDGESAGFFSPAPDPDPMPERIGRYKIIREIGRGGMGVVYLGVHEDDRFQKRVAIKLVKRGVDTSDVLRRFETERQVLNALSHPNIARVIDGGAADDGRPYFVMEYIEGQPVDAYCDAQNLSTANRLTLFTKICSAVHYAHQNLVVHRDLKPGNILVTVEGEPKLLDFGIAKLLNPELLRSAEATGPEIRLMTPEYASPEQVRGDPITTTSDVYSLGVLLYQLLTGHHPYRFATRLQEEIVRIICESEPERPSTAIGQTEEIRRSDGTTRRVTPESVAKARDGQPRKLRSRLAGDIDNIILHAMEKAPRRRYASAEQFAEDISRHLVGEPVIARRQTPFYRAAKFVRRNRRGVAVAVVFALLLVASTITTTAGWRSASRQRRIAEAQRAVAQERFEQVQSLAHTFLTDFETSIRQLKGATKVRELFVTTALEYLNKLAEQAQSDPSLLRELALGYDRVGGVQGGLRGGSVGGPLESIKHLRKSLEIRRRLAAADPNDADLRRDIARSDLHIGDALSVTRRTEDADASYADAMAILDALLKADPDDAASMSLHAAVATKQSQMLKRRGDLAGAIDLARRSLAARERLAAIEPTDLNRRNLTVGYTSLGAWLSQAGDLDAAGEQYNFALRVRSELAAANPNNASYQRDLALAHRRLAALEADRHNDEASLQGYALSHDILRRLAEADPENTRARADVALSLALLGAARAEVGDSSAAISDFTSSLRQYEKLRRVRPGDTSDMQAVSALLSRRGNTLLALHRESEALGDYFEARRLNRRLVDLDPDNTNLRRNLAVSAHKVGDAHLALGDAEAARDDYLEALSIAEPLSRDDPANVKKRLTLAVSRAKLSAAFAAMAEDPAASAVQRLDLLRQAREHDAKSLTLFKALNEVKGGAGRFDDTITELEADIAQLDKKINSPQ